MFMNNKNWIEVVKLSIKELSEIGIDFVKHNRIVCAWNIQFCMNERFDVPHNRYHVEPNPFAYFPEVKRQFIHYCNNKVKTGEICTELAHAELTQVIVPGCYTNMVQESNDKKDIISYDDLLRILDMKSISISST